MSSPTPLKIQMFGQKLRALRQRQGLTLKELAAALGYTAHGHVSELETGKKTPTVEFVLSVALFFDVTTDLLLRDDCSLQNENLTGKDNRI